MKCTFVVTGWENISVEYLSSAIKRRGHIPNLAYNQALFDDKNYVCIKPLANILRQEENVLKQVLESKPDLVAFSVMAVTYQWCLMMAGLIKKYIDVPVIFGGVHPSAIPEKVIAEPVVDMICIGEGEEPLIELLDSLTNGKVDYSIKNLWFKKNGEIIKNPRRRLIQDLNKLPLLDKELFVKHVPIKNYYLAVVSRGCPFACSFCSLSLEAQENLKLGDKRYRERTVENVINELVAMKKKYNYKWIDFRNSVFSSSKDWTVEFCNEYKKKINLPFRIFSHPLLVSDEAVKALKSANCFAVQLGLESYDEYIRNNILKRMETNAQIHQAIDILEKNEVNYSLDYILGLPNQNEDELIRAAGFFSNLKYCYRISPFMCQYLPGLELIRHGNLDKEEIEKIDNGLHGNYMSGGSLDKRQLLFFNKYRVYFRLMSFMPVWLKKIVLKHRKYILFLFTPFRFLIGILDLSIAVRDIDARTYLYNYIWWFRQRFKNKHPSSFGYAKEFKKAVREYVKNYEKGIFNV